MRVDCKGMAGQTTAESNAGVLVSAWQLHGIRFKSTVCISPNRKILTGTFQLEDRVLPVAMYNRGRTLLFYASDIAPFESP